MKPYKKLVGERIQKRREELGLSSQDALANALHEAGARNVDQSRISRWESGQALPSKLFRSFLERVLKLTEDELFGQIEMHTLEPPKALPVHQIEALKQATREAIREEFHSSPTSDLSKEESDVIELFRALTPKGQKVALSQLSAILEDHRRPLAKAAK